MRLYFFLSSILLAPFLCYGQSVNTTSIFAHNDYLKPDPFYGAYREQVSFIEADIFVEQSDLLVAHTKEELDPRKTLESLYLKPLRDEIVRNNGFAYRDHEKMLTLMLDLKTAGMPTVLTLIDKLKRYPELINCRTLSITLSGNVPNPAQWNEIPSYLTFDGRPSVVYSKSQLERVRLISTSFTEISKWNGKGVIPAEERLRVIKIIDHAHTLNKPIRFWAAPDFINAWIKLMDLKIDIINTDDVRGLSQFLREMQSRVYENKTAHTVYQPLYKKTDKAAPRNIILMIGDGMGLAQLYSGFTANHGALNIFNMRDVGFSVTNSTDSYITDSAAGATAMATGRKTNNRFIGVDSAGNKLPTIAEKLKQKGLNTALISNGDITDATPASFYAHQPERSLSEAIALDALNSTIDILIGGGAKSFSKRNDGRMLLSELNGKGYAVATNFNAIDTLRGKKFVVIDDSAVVSKIKGRDDFLQRSLRKCTEGFKKQNSFFVMLEGAQIDWGGHANNMEYVVREVLDFDQAVGDALRFADENGETLVIVTADHETGGLSLIGGDISKGSVMGHFSTNDHTGIMVPIFAYGPGASYFRGVHQNTDIYKLMESLLLKTNFVK